MMVQVDLLAQAKAAWDSAASAVSAGRKRHVAKRRHREIDAGHEHRVHLAAVSALLISAQTLVARSACSKSDSVGVQAT